MPRNKVAFVSGSFFSVSAQVDAGTAVVREFFRDASKPNGLALLHEVTTTGTVINDRVLAQPIVICYQGNLLVAQFIIQHAPQVHFLVIDMLQKKYFVFHDTNRHFIRDSAIAEGVLCTFSPDHHLMILRLPRSGLALPHKSSLTLTVRKEHHDLPISMSNHVTGTERFRLQDRRFYMLAFDPRFPRRMVSLSLNEYGSKCFVMSRDQDTQTTVFQKVLPLGQLSVDQENRNQASESERDSGASSGSDDDSFDPPLAFLLVSCSMEFCKMGDVVTLCCCVVDSTEQFYLRLFLLESDTFNCIKQVAQPMGRCDKLSDDPFQISFSPCDSQVVVHGFLKCGACTSHFTVCGVSIPRNLSLRDHCRVAILRNLAPGANVRSLPLPTALIEFLLFNNHKYRGD